MEFARCRVVSRWDGARPCPCRPSPAIRSLRAPSPPWRILRSAPEVLVCYLLHVQCLPMARLAWLLREMRGVFRAKGVVVNLCRRVADRLQ